jgi:hypothetical protein
MTMNRMMTSSGMPIRPMVSAPYVVCAGTGRRETVKVLYHQGQYQAQRHVGLGVRGVGGADAGPANESRIDADLRGLGDRQPSEARVTLPRAPTARPIASAPGVDLQPLIREIRVPCVVSGPGLDRSAPLE